MIWKNFDDAGRSFVLAQFKTYRDPMQVYLPRAHEVYDGHFPPGELFADPGSPTIQNPLPSLLLSSFIYVFGGNMNLAYLGAQFIFSGIIFLLFYVLGLALLGSRLWAWFLGLIATITPIAVKLPFYKWSGVSEFMAFFVNNFIPWTRTQFDQLYLTRVDEPLITYPFYIGAIIAFWFFWKNPSRKTAIIAAATSALLFYVYFHHWVYWIVATGVLFIYAAIKRKQDPVVFKNYLWFYLILAICVIPYFAGYFNFHSLSSAQDFIWREGVAFGRDIGVVRQNLADYAVYILLAVGVYFAYWKTNRRKSIFFLGLIAAMFIVWNIQLVIGYVPVPQFFRRPISPVIFLMLFSLVKDLIARWSPKDIDSKKIIAGVLIVLAVFAVTKKVTNIAQIAVAIQSDLVEYYDFSDDLVSSWSWVNRNLPGEPKIVSPSTMTSMYLLTYTGARPFLPTGWMSLLSMKDIENRYLIAHKLFGVSQAELEKRLFSEMPVNCGDRCFPDQDSNLNDSAWHIYGSYFTSQYGSFDHFLSASNQDVVDARTDERLRQLIDSYPAVEADWRSVNADYVYYGPWEKQIIKTDLSGDRDLELVYKNPSVEIYKIKR